MHGPQIWHWVIQSAKNCQTRLWVASAFVTDKRLNKLNSLASNRQLQKVIVTRWQFSDLLSGASNLKAYEVARDNGWRFYVNLDLHAKAYIFDEACAIGSANLTDKGMYGFTPPGNREVLAYCTDYVSLIDWYQEIVGCSIELSDEIYQQVCDLVDNKLLDHQKTNVDDSKYNVLFESPTKHAKENGLYTHDLFWTNNILTTINQLRSGDSSRDIEHDLSIMGIQNTTKDAVIGARFIGTKAFKWLLSAVDNVSYFGELSSKLHEVLKDDPTPFRKDVKILLSNLLEWTSAYGADYFIIDRPNHSQRIRRI